MEQNHQVENIVIAIDGISASGKTTLTKELAKHYQIPYLLTGNLYRALALKVQNLNLDNIPEIDIKQAIEDIKLNDLESSDLKSETASSYASKIAKIPKIREWLNVFQKRWIASHKKSIVEGRDIGTIIYPNATVKLFITASPEIRAQRRFEELKDIQENVSYETILKNIKNRDDQDINREIAPLKKAEDAITIDTTDKTIQNMITTAIKIIEKKIDNI